MLCVHAEVNNSDWWDVPYEVATSDVEWNNNYLSLFPLVKEDASEAPLEVSEDSSSAALEYSSDDYIDLFSIEDLGTSTFRVSNQLGYVINGVFSSSASFTVDYTSNNISQVSSWSINSANNSLRNQFWFTSVNSDCYINEGDSMQMSLSGIRNILQVNGADTYPLLAEKISDYRITLFNINGKSIPYSGYTINFYNRKTGGNSNDNPLLFMEIDFPAVSEDVYGMYISYTYDFSDYGVDFTSSDDYDILFGFDNSSIDVDYLDADGERGLLNNIIGWLVNIVDGIGNLFNAIIELPGKLISLLSDLLQSLFVPTSEELELQAEKWDSLLQSRFGAIYTATNLIIDFCNNILTLSPQDQTMIDFPAVTVNLAGADFTFGGFAVSVVPDGFSFLVGSVKAVVAILVTLLFVNALKKRFEKLLGGEGD